MKNLKCLRFPDTLRSKRMVYVVNPEQEAAREVGEEKAVLFKKLDALATGKDVDAAKAGLKADMDGYVKERIAHYKKHDAANAAKMEVELNKLKNDFSKDGGDLDLKAEQCKLQLLKDAQEKSMVMGDELAQKRRTEMEAAAEKKKEIAEGLKDADFNHYAAVDYVKDGEITNKIMHRSYFRTMMVNMIEAVYIARGKEAADELFNKLMTTKDLSYVNLKGANNLSLAMGVESNPPIITFDPVEYKELVGYLYGYMYAAQQEFKGDKAYEAKGKYLKYLEGAAHDAANKEWQRKRQEILSPAEWVKKYAPNYATSLEAINEATLDMDRYAKINALLSRIPEGMAFQRDLLGGVCFAALKAEPDVKKWDRALYNVLIEARLMDKDDANNMEAGGMTLTVLLDKIAKLDADKNLKPLLNGREIYGQQAWEADPKTKGYISGLAFKAETVFKDQPARLAEYKKYLHDRTDSAEYKALVGGEHGPLTELIAARKELEKGKGGKPEGVKAHMLHWVKKELESDDRKKMFDSMNAAGDKVFLLTCQSLQLPEDWAKGPEVLKQQGTATATPKAALKSNATAAVGPSATVTAVAGGSGKGPDKNTKGAKAVGTGAVAAESKKDDATGKLLEEKIADGQKAAKGLLESARSFYEKNLSWSSSIYRVLNRYQHKSLAELQQEGITDPESLKTKAKEELAKEFGTRVKESTAPMVIKGEKITPAPLEDFTTQEVNGYSFKKVGERYSVEMNDAAATAWSKSVFEKAAGSKEGQNLSGLLQVQQTLKSSGMESIKQAILNNKKIKTRSDLNHAIDGVIAAAVNKAKADGKPLPDGWNENIVIGENHRFKAYVVNGDFRSSNTSDYPGIYSELRSDPNFPEIADK